MTTLSSKIDRAMIYLIVVMLTFMVSLFFAKFNLTPSMVRHEVLENRKIILEALDTIELARTELLEAQEIAKAALVRDDQQKGIIQMLEQLTSEKTR